MKIHFAISVFCLVSCSRNAAKSDVQKIGDREFAVSDSTSTIAIGHCDITECLDAEIAGGKLYFPDSVFENIKKAYAQHGNPSVPNQRDLYLTGAKNITYELFDSILGPKMGNRYEVKGKVVGFRGYGAIFRVDSYKIANKSQYNAR